MLLALVTVSHEVHFPSGVMLRPMHHSMRGIDKPMLNIKSCHPSPIIWTIVLKSRPHCGIEKLRLSSLLPWLSIGTEAIQMLPSNHFFAHYWLSSSVAWLNGAVRRIREVIHFIFEVLRIIKATGLSFLQLILSYKLKCLFVVRK
jgi:hypothetical protein